MKNFKDTPDDELKKAMIKKLADHLEANKDEINRAQTELPVIKPF